MVDTCNAQAGTSLYITLEVCQTCFPGILIFWMWKKKVKIHSQTDTLQQILKCYSQVCNVQIPNVNVQMYIQTLHKSSTAYFDMTYNTISNSLRVLSSGL